MSVVTVETPEGVVVKVDGGEPTSDYINKLDDSAFLHIAPGGTKDADGRTVPRSKRFFPVKDDHGKIDIPLLKTAIEKAPNSSLPAKVKKSIQTKAKKMLIQAKKEDEQNNGFAIVGRMLRKADEQEGTTKHYVMNVVLEPCTKDSTIDTQGDYYTEEDIWQARRTFMEKQGVGLFHDNPDVNGISLLDNWITPFGFDPNDHGMPGDPVLKGTWLQGMEIDEEVNPKAWEGIVKGELQSFSIEGAGIRTTVEDENEGDDTN